MNKEMDAIYILTPLPHIVDCLMADLERRKYKRAFLIWTSGGLALDRDYCRGDMATIRVLTPGSTTTRSTSEARSVISGKGSDCSAQDFEHRFLSKRVTSYYFQGSLEFPDVVSPCMQSISPKTYG